jgi:hypothetical protein
MTLQETTRGVERRYPSILVYMPAAVRRAVKQLALDRDVKPNAILLEAIDLLLQRYGRGSVAELSKDGTKDGEEA